MGEMIGLVAVVLIFGVPIIAIWTQHQRKLLEMKLMLGNKGDNGLRAEFEALREEVRSLRDTRALYVGVPGRCRTGTMRRRSWQWHAAEAVCPGRSVAQSARGAGCQSGQAGSNSRTFFGTPAHLNYMRCVQPGGER